MYLLDIQYLTTAMLKPKHRQLEPVIEARAELTSSFIN
jgi:hypothetical protein